MSHPLFTGKNTNPTTSTYDDAKVEFSKFSANILSLNLHSDL